MTYFELLILAISLSFDTFAVSVSGGIALNNIKFSKKAVIMAFFAGFQAVFLSIGWFIGGKFASIITEWDHWIAFAILFYIGSKMFIESFKKDNPHDKPAIDLLNYKKLSVLSVATSIDAVAVGVSLAFISLSTPKLLFAALITFVITALACYIGLKGGQKLGSKIGSRAELLGGLILIAIGVRILVEHLFF